MSTSDNFDGSNAIGNGEVDSSILSGSTSHPIEMSMFLFSRFASRSRAKSEWNHRVTTRALFRGKRRTYQSPICLINERDRFTPNDREQFTVRQRFHREVALYYLRGPRSACDAGSWWLIVDA
jgi:hypothetical protein